MDGHAEEKMHICHVCGNIYIYLREGETVELFLLKSSS